MLTQFTCNAIIHNRGFICHLAACILCVLCIFFFLYFSSIVFIWLQVSGWLPVFGKLDCENFCRFLCCFHGKKIQFGGTYSTIFDDTTLIIKFCSLPLLHHFLWYKYVLTLFHEVNSLEPILTAILQIFRCSCSKFLSILVLIYCSPIFS